MLRRLPVNYLYAVIFFILIFFILHLVAYNSSSPEIDFDKLNHRVKRLEGMLAKYKADMQALRAGLDELESLQNSKSSNLISGRGWPHPIPVLVFVCNRPNAVRNHVSKLLKYRPSAENFPIVVSQDCDDGRVPDALSDFMNSITYIKHRWIEKTDLRIPSSHKRFVTYYMIARHYKLGLNYIFRSSNYSSVIITEDDLDIAPDFFEYFSATRYLLDEDPSLYCISAWNDNGIPSLVDMTQPDVLYRTDFFPGLGWMMTRELWKELIPKWPRGFWDDWIREIPQRRNRACVRPEIPRTAMTTEGKRGASMGMFSRHLSKIAANKSPVNFTSINLEYLLKDNYDRAFLLRVYSAKMLNIESWQREIIEAPKNQSYRLQYRTMEEYLVLADSAGIMRDFKVGVPRTAYYGVVTCFFNGRRIFIAPEQSTWTGYNASWEAPQRLSDMMT